MDYFLSFFFFFLFFFNFLKLKNTPTKQQTKGSFSFPLSFSFPPLSSLPLHHPSILFFLFFFFMSLLGPLYSALRQKFSRDKTRFSDGKFDLDLTYITDRIIGNQ